MLALFGFNAFNVGIYLFSYSDMICFDVFIYVGPFSNMNLYIF